jgi:hypothetical protein
MSERSQIFFLYKALIFSFIALGTLSTFAQQKRFYGKIINKYSKQPLAGVSIIAGKQKLISNGNGMFYFSMNKTSSNKIVLSFSFLGYNSIEVEEPEDNSFLLIEMINTENQLKEVIVQSGGRSIIEKAISRIPENYLTKAFMFSGIQRIYEQINDTEYFYKNDALLKIHVPALGNSKSKIITTLTDNRFLLIDNFDSAIAKKNGDITHWKGAYTALSNFDYIHNPRSFIEPDNDIYSYLLQGKIVYDGRTVYIIDFYPKNIKKGISEGTIFIDSATYAFAHFYVLQGQEYFDKFPSSRKYNHTFSLAEVNYTIREDGKWYIQNCHIENRVLKENAIAFKNVLYGTVDFFLSSIDTTTSTTHVIPRKIRLSEDDVTIDINSSNSSHLILDSLLNTNAALKFLTVIPIPIKKSTTKN